MENDPFKVLGVPYNSTLKEIKSAYRNLAKKYHPDTGGDEERILRINAAWEILKVKKNRESYGKYLSNIPTNTSKLNAPKNDGLNKDKAISFWLKVIYKPIDRLMGEIINCFPQQLKDLSADPYDDDLMKSFCEYIEKSQKKIIKIQEIYQSVHTPSQINNFSLSLYQCFSEIQDGINEWERFTAGYVESYLHDGNEMLRSAKKQRLTLQKEKNHLEIF